MLYLFHRDKVPLAVAVILSLLVHLALNFIELEESNGPAGSSSAVNVSLRQLPQEGEQRQEKEKISESAISAAKKIVDKAKPEQSAKDASTAKLDKKIDQVTRAQATKELPGKNTQESINKNIRQKKSKLLGEVEKTSELSRSVAISASVHASSHIGHPSPEKKQDIKAVVSEKSDSEKLAEPSEVALGSAIEKESSAQAVSEKPEALSESSELIQVKAKYVLGSAANPKPIYPSLARKRGWEGTVLIGVNVDEYGGIESLLIIESSYYGVLDYEAYETIRNSWTFSPAMVAGQAVPSYVEVPVRFEITRSLH